MKKILLITPPFVQLSSPYAATPFLKGFLQHENIVTDQMDLSIELFLKLFSREGMTLLFDGIEKGRTKKQFITNESIDDMILKKYAYIDTVEEVVKFLQGDYPQLAHKIGTGNYLPRGERFTIIESYTGQHKKVAHDPLHLASLYIDDIVDLARKTILPHFELASYRSSAASPGIEFSEIERQLDEENLLTGMLYALLENKITEKYALIGITVPFPGNLYMALKTAAFLKKITTAKIVLGGGYINTDLKHLRDSGIFRYVDFITLDDGELPLRQLFRFVSGECHASDLIRTFAAENNDVIFYDAQGENQSTIYTTPDYTGLDLEKYITLHESLNPMHALWSEKGYLKLRMAHGCYHKRCRFCDTELDYIQSYYPETAENLVASIEQIIAETGVRSFHFVDEAMPPALIKKIALLVLDKKIDITWWGNVRFDRAFSAGLCELMGKAGCIAVTGGLESADNRILGLMNKGTTVENDIYVCSHFAEAGIMVHGYLIYGFPTETISECINSLEIIRQMFAQKLLTSGFYHRFALTIHSELYQAPERYGIELLEKPRSAFSNNDAEYRELAPTEIDRLGDGLHKALYNFNYRNCLQEPVGSWFPNIKWKQKRAPDFVRNLLKTEDKKNIHRKPLWTGTLPDIKKGMIGDSVVFSFAGVSGAFSYELPVPLADWFYTLLSAASVKEWIKKEPPQLEYFFITMPDGFFSKREDLLYNEIWLDLEKAGLWLL